MSFISNKLGEGHEWQADDMPSMSKGCTLCDESDKYFTWEYRRAEPMSSFPEISTEALVAADRSLLICMRVSAKEGSSS